MAGDIAQMLARLHCRPIVIATHNEALVARFSHPVLRLAGGVVRVGQGANQNIVQPNKGSAA